MDSLRDLCVDIGIDDDDLSLARHFFGFSRGTVPAALVGATTSVSVQDQIAAIRGRHFNVNCIRVGSENFSNSDVDEIDEAMHLTRVVLGRAGLGIGRIEHYVIPVADADGLETITSVADAEQLTLNWTVPNDGQDLFFVLNWVADDGKQVLGRSNIDGPCDKNDQSTGQSGSITAMVGTRQNTGRTTAHELGHYLGLVHRNEDGTNLMCQTGTVGDLGGSVNLATLVDSGQRADISDHCSVQEGI